MAGASAIALIVAAAGIFLIRQPKYPQSFRVFPLAGNAGLEMSPAFSPNSKQVAYSWDGNRRNFDIYVKPVEGGVPHRILALTAHANRADMDRCFAAGMDDYLTKPIDVEQLTERLRKIAISA